MLHNLPHTAGLLYESRSAGLNDRHSHPKLGASDKPRPSSWIELYYGEVYHGMRVLSRTRLPMESILINKKRHCCRLPIRILHAWGERAHWPSQQGEFDPLGYSFVD
jgi:hypothetical protein